MDDTAIKQIKTLVRLNLYILCTDVARPNVILMAKKVKHFDYKNILRFNLRSFVVMTLVSHLVLFTLFPHIPLS